MSLVTDEEAKRRADCKFGEEFDDRMYKQWQARKKRLRDNPRYPIQFTYWLLEADAAGRRISHFKDRDDKDFCNHCGYTNFQQDEYDRCG
jgi:hypothetical protein